MTIGQATPKDRTRPRWAWMLIISAAVALGLSAGLFLETRSLENETATASFEAYAEARAQEIETEFISCVATLQSLRSLFDSSELVKPGEFAIFAEQLMTQSPSIVRLAWAPRVLGSELADFVHRNRVSDAEPFRVTRRGDDGRPVEVHETDRTLFPILHEQVAQTRRQRIGFDLGSDPDCGEAITRAGVAQTAVMTPVSGDDEQAEPVGFVTVFLAVRAAPASDPAYLESSLEGVVLMEIRLPDVVRNALGSAYDDVLQAGEYRLFLEDGDGLGPSGLVPAWDSESRTVAVPDRLVDVSFDIAGRRFWLEAGPSEGFLSNLRTANPALIATIALLLCAGLIAGGLCHLRALALRADRERDRLLRSVLASIEEGVVVADRSGDVRYVNAAAGRMLGPIADSPPQDWSTVCGIQLGDGEASGPVEQVPLIRATRGHSVHLEHMFVRNASAPDGAWLSVSGSPLLDEENELQGGIAVLRDVTRQKRAEVEIRRLSSVVEQTADAVMVTDSRGVIVYVNPAFEQMTGFVANEALGRTPRILRSGRHDPEDYDRLWRTLRGGDVYRGRLTNRRGDGSFFECEHTITPIRDDDGGEQFFVAVSRDVSESKGTFASETPGLGPGPPENPTRT